MDYRLIPQLIYADGELVDAKAAVPLDVAVVDVDVITSMNLDTVAGMIGDGAVAQAKSLGTNIKTCPRASPQKIDVSRGYAMGLRHV